MARMEGWTLIAMAPTDCPLVPGAASGSVEINLSYDIESRYWDFLIFEVHTVGQDDWTTLEVPGLTSQGLGTSARDSS
jgi:hypothetical protein